MISRTNRWPRITGTPFGLIRIWIWKCKIYAFFRKLWDKYQEMEALLNKQTEGEADKDEDKAESEDED